MRFLAVAVLLAFGLGCAGIGEDLLEMATGGDVQITEDGMVMTMEDGAKLTVINGERAVPPEGFPLAPPSEGAKAQALTTMVSPEGEESTMLTYTLDAPKEAVLATYQAWFEGQGITPVHAVENELGTHSESLVGTLPDGRQAGVMINQAFGQDSLTLMAGHDLEALRKQ